MTQKNKHLPACPILIGMTCLTLALPAIVACSTTKAIPEGEQLYTGIKSIDYTDNPTLLRKKQKADSTGVIAAVARAVTEVNKLLHGQASLQADSLLRHPEKELTKEERKAFKQYLAQEQADFDQAQEEIDAVLGYPPNNSIFGSSSMSFPWKFGLWTYNHFHDSDSKLGKWIFKRFSTEPVLISKVSPEMRSKVATNTLHNYGFFHGKVDYSILTQSNPKKAKIQYTVQTGNIFRLDSIAYLHYPARMDSLLQQHKDERLLRSGDAFNVVQLSNEQTRIENLFRNHGYYFFKAGYTTFRADTIQKKEYVQLQVVPVKDRPKVADRPWYMGHTYINVQNQKYSPLDQQQTQGDYTFCYAGKKIPLKENIWKHAINHQHGNIFRIDDQNQSLRKLGAMGVLSQVDINYVPRDTTENCDTLDVYVTAKMDKLYDSTFEVNAMFKSNQQVGPGISYELAKRNAFRGGEKVAFKIYGSYEWQTGAGGNNRNSLMNSYELGTRLSLKYPRFMLPFMSRIYHRYPVSTEFVLDGNWKNRSKFFNMVSMSIGATYSWQKKETMTHELTLFQLEFDKLNHTTFAFDSIMTENPALYISMRDQFVPSLSYTFTYQSSKKKRNPWWVQLSVKEAGNFTSACYALAGQKFNKQGKRIFGNPFAQFIKFSAEAHKLFKFTKDIQVATRIFGGIIYSYGNSTAAPYVDQFYVGGANSIRGFAIRSLGPGSFKPADSKYAYMDQTGDIKFEANAELRARLIGNLHGAVFLDAGNIWTLRSDPKRPGGKFGGSTLKSIALGTGAGIRYDLDFLILRLDCGIALHAPYETGKSGFYNIPKFKDGIGIHFAIGYPF